MSTRINTNTTAVMASRNLNVNSDHESTDIQRLSTGLRINSAADDAAGLVISQNMNAQLVGLNQATSNTNDAINEVKTAENALGEVQSLLMTMRSWPLTLPTKASTNSTDVSADQEEINRRSSRSTEFPRRPSSAPRSFSTARLRRYDHDHWFRGRWRLRGCYCSEGRWNAGNAFDYTRSQSKQGDRGTAEVGAKGNIVLRQGHDQRTSYDLGTTEFDCQGA